MPITAKKPLPGDEFWDRHPSDLESLIPVYGPAREATADWHDGDYLGAVGNGALAVSDIFPALEAAKVGGRSVFVAGKVLLRDGDAARALKKAGQQIGKFGGSDTWDALRKQMTGDGRKAPGMHGHHWAIPQNGWGKAVPNRLKNQPWNIKVLDPVTHGRLTGSYKGLPRYSPAGQIWYGAPAWAKGAVVAAPGHAISLFDPHVPGLDTDDEP